MRCPVCNNALHWLHNHNQIQSEGIEARAYDIRICILGGNVCNGLIVKHDVFDQKYTFITPSHNVTTLHTNYVNQVTSEELLRTVLSTFEWCALKGY